MLRCISLLQPQLIRSFDDFPKKDASFEFRKARTVIRRKPNLFYSVKMENYFKKSAWTNIFMITDHAVIYCPRQPHFHYWLRIGEILAQGYSKKFYQGEAPLRGSTPYLFYMPFFDRKGTRFLYLLLKNGAPFTYLVYNSASLSTAVNVLSLNMMNKSQNQNVSSTSSRPHNESVSPLNNFYRPKWQISLPFHIL